VIAKIGTSYVIKQNIGKATVAQTLQANPIFALALRQKQGNEIECYNDADRCQVLYSTCGGSMARLPDPTSNHGIPVDIH
jgi:hypothetical protein